MAWSEKTKTALDQWVHHDTWHKAHPIDDSRFGVFIASVWNDEHRIWDESMARELIAQAAIRFHPDCSVLVKEVAEARVAEGSTILDFLSLLQKTGHFGLLTCSGA